MNFEDVRRELTDRGYESNGPTFANIPIRIEMGSARPQPRRHPRFSDDWFEDEPRPGELYAKRCQEFIKAYYPELNPPPVWLDVPSLMQEVWSSQRLSNQFSSWALLDRKYDPNADLHEFAVSARRSQERRRKRTLRERLPRPWRRLPKMYWRQWPWNPGVRPIEDLDDEY